MLKENDRLVHPHANGEMRQVMKGWTKYWSNASKFDMMNRLGAYEDLGYTPEELRAMLREKD